MKQNVAVVLSIEHHNHPRTDCHLLECDGGCRWPSYDARQQTESERALCATQAYEVIFWWTSPFFSGEHNKKQSKGFAIHPAKNVVEDVTDLLGIKLSVETPLFHSCHVQFQAKHHGSLKQMSKDGNKDFDISAKQVDTNCVNMMPKDANSSDVTLLHITQQSAITPLSMDLISSFSFSSEITKNVTMVLSRKVINSVEATPSVIIWSCLGSWPAMRWEELTTDRWCLKPCTRI